MREESQWRVRGGEWRALITFAIAASSLFGAAALVPRIASAQKQPQRANELTLAGLRPGRDTYDAAVRKYREPLQQASGDSKSAPENSGQANWFRGCDGHSLHIEFDSNKVIQTVDLDSYKKATSICQMIKPDSWATGAGISPGMKRESVIAAYGKPGSVSPSRKDGRELELLYYAFDWAGPDVPQVMEITCERASGRVVEIMLAFPSL